jgi:glycosyltransferase involved in cell wall biosynthesis
MKVEKGIFSLFKIFDELNTDVELSVVAKTEDYKMNNKKIKFINFEDNVSALIKIYDNHNILILPSFTEAHPKVIDESLARERPVIIFEELNQKIQNRYGVFVSKRNSKSFTETIEFIMRNYSNIQESMKRNMLPTKQEFISQMTQILS